MDDENKILPHEEYLKMLKDDEHESFGAMYHRGLVEARTNTRNYHDDIKRSMDIAVEVLQRIVSIYRNDATYADGTTAWRMKNQAKFALEKITEIMK